MKRKTYCGTVAKADGNGENKPHPKIMGVPCQLTKRFLVLGLSYLVLSGGRALGQDPASLDSNDEVRDAARLSLAQGVVWMKQRAATDPEGWIIGPVQFAKLRDYTNITVRCTMKKVWEPCYTSVVAFVQDTVGAPLRKVSQMRRIANTSNAVERLVQDPDGSVVREGRIPLFDRVGNISWSACGIGDAALAAYALRKAGVPESDPIMAGVLVNLRNHIDTFGLPDQTWNLAWLTVVFAGSTNKLDGDLTQRLASRLMDGQIMDGAARGLWGPLSVNHGLLAVMVRDYLAMMVDFQKKELRLKEKSDKGKSGKAVQAALDELRETMERRKALTESEICQRGFRFSNVEDSWIVDPQADTKIMLPGADHLLYNQTAADMESTWVALFALSVAAENRQLPAQSWRPNFVSKPGVASSPIPRPERSEAVIARAVNALVAQQAKDGRWSECNQHQPVTKFDTFTATLPVPCDPKSFMPLASPFTALSTAQGMHALDRVGLTVGMKRLMNTFKAPYLAGVSASRKELETRLALVWPKPTVRPVFSRADYNLFLTLSHPLAGIAEAGVATQDNDKLVRALVLAANPTGSWGGVALYTWTLPSSSRARGEALKGMPSEIAKAHITPVNAGAGVVQYSPLRRDAEGVSTAMALLFLASYVDNPAATLTELAALPDLATLRKDAVQRLMVKKAPAPVAAPAPPIKVVPPPAPAAATVVPAPTPAPSAAESDVPQMPAAPVEANPKADETF